MLCTCLALALSSSPAAPPNLHRDAFGVPHIVGKNWGDVFYQAGYACAQDRLWQMETSRRLSEGRMAEAFGKSFVNSDKQVLQFAYTKEELNGQFASLSAKAQAALTNYAQGVNACIQDRQRSGTLPPEYTQYGLKPEPWAIHDSIAIAIRLFQLFGRGGAGELRNLALLGYLRTQPKAKDKALDILDDFAWQNDPASIPTLPASEDPQATRPPLKVAFTRKQTEAQLAAIPKYSLFELLPAIQLAERSEVTRVAEREHVPYHTGSYCAVVGAKLSAVRRPLLLSGPQMGFTEPSIIHEMALEGPGFKAAGIDIPGVPGVVLGMTDRFAWGLTSGVADTEDIYDFKTSGAKGYIYGTQTLEEREIPFPLRIKGAPDQTVTQARTIFGPIVLKGRGHVFARRSAYRNVEMQSFDALLGLYGAKSASQVERSIEGATMNFNFFYAMSDGDFGYRYLGRIPIRATGIDPRFPTPAEPRTSWKGFLSPAQLPHIRNPRKGLLANWNNKPAAWWPNYDTPVWGRIFRNEVLLGQLQKKLIGPTDLERAVANIAKIDPNFSYFRPYLLLAKPPANEPNADAATDALHSFDGRMVNGSLGAAVYIAFFSALREQLFLGTTGNFVDPSFFSQIAQPSVMLNALQGKTKVDYLGGRTAAAVVNAAMAAALRALNKTKGTDMSAWRYKAGGIPVRGEAPIPYSNRGSYIQIVQLKRTPTGENILPPGESEYGLHAKDQAPLARVFGFKPFHW